jgi:opacity protein-like surface antigen
MKKLLLISVVLFIAAVSHAQDKFVYCELVGTENITGTKVTVSIDFGQATKMWSDNRLVGEDGKPVKFNSMVDAMNFMGNQGWEFTQAYVAVLGGQCVYHWLLKKNVSLLTDEERTALLDGIKTKSIFKAETKK